MKNIHVKNVKRKYPYNFITIKEKAYLIIKNCIFRGNTVSNALIKLEAYSVLKIENSHFYGIRTFKNEISCIESKEGSLVKMINVTFTKCHNNVIWSNGNLNIQKCIFEDNLKNSHQDNLIMATVTIFNF